LSVFFPFCSIEIDQIPALPSDLCWTFFYDSPSLSFFAANFTSRLLRSGKKVSLLIEMICACPLTYKFAKSFLRHFSPGCLFAFFILSKRWCTSPPPKVKRNSSAFVFIQTSCCLMDIVLLSRTMVVLDIIPFLLVSPFLPLRRPYPDPLSTTEKPLFLPSS